jgi:hypothetical protein
VRSAGEGFHNWMNAGRRNVDQLLAVCGDRVGEGGVPGRCGKSSDDGGVHFRLLCLFSSVQMPGGAR